MRYKTVIFDLDGTILDTIEDLAEATNHALASQGLPRRSLAEVRSIVGNGIRNLIVRACPPDTPSATIDAAFAEFKRYYADHCEDNTKPYPGITDLLRSIRADGVSTAVVSNKADFAVQKLIENHFPGLFDAVVGEREGVRRKPAPDSVNAVLAELGIESGDALYVGDSEVDIATARNAKTSCVLVSWGYRDVETLRENGAETIVDTMDGLRGQIS